MLCITPCAEVSRMGQIDQMDQMDSIFFHSNRTYRMVKWCHDVHNINVTSQMDPFSLLM